MKFRIVLFVVLFLLSFTLPMLAQDGSVGQSIDDWLVFAAASVTLLTSLFELVIRYLFPDTQIRAGVVGGWVQAFAIVIFLGAGLLGFMENLNAGVEFLNGLAGPLTSIAILVFGPDALRPQSERRILGREQGARATSLN